MPTCEQINGNYTDAMTNSTVGMDLMSGLYCPYFDSVSGGVANGNGAAMIVLLSLAIYIGVVNRSFYMLSAYLLICISVMAAFITYAQFNVFLFLVISGCLGWGLFLVYRRLGGDSTDGRQ
tara:strand:- start:1590 stop:1952 length:363 start_codon:yes stop_codon:yes gene_type:complete